MGIKLKDLRRGDIIFFKDYVGIVAMTKMSMVLTGQMNVLVYFIGENGEEFDNFLAESIKKSINSCNY